MTFPGVRLLFLLSIALLLAACTTPAPSSFESKFERAGRFVVQVQVSAEPPESVQGGFRWRQAQAGWQLDLLSPLGATLARLDASPGVVILQQPDKPPRRAASASALVSSLFGAQVPVDAFEGWMQGKIVDASSADDIQRDAQGRVVSMRQDGWSVRLDRYDGLGPRLIQVSGTDQGRTVSLRLVVDSERHGNDAEQTTLKVSFSEVSQAS